MHDYVTLCSFQPIDSKNIQDKVTLSEEGKFFSTLKFSVWLHATVVNSY